MEDNLVKLTIKIDKDLYEKASEICRRQGITIERVVEAFVEFCVIPENLKFLLEMIEYPDNKEVAQIVFRKVVAIVKQK